MNEKHYSVEYSSSTRPITDLYGDGTDIGTIIDMTTHRDEPLPKRTIGLEPITDDMIPAVEVRAGRLIAGLKDMASPKEPGRQLGTFEKCALGVAALGIGLAGFAMAAKTMMEHAPTDPQSSEPLTAGGIVQTYPSPSDTLSSWPATTPTSPETSSFTTLPSSTTSSAPTASKTSSSPSALPTSIVIPSSTTSASKPTSKPSPVTSPSSKPTSRPTTPAPVTSTQPHQAAAPNGCEFIVHGNSLEVAGCSKDTDLPPPNPAFGGSGFTIRTGMWIQIAQTTPGGDIVKIGNSSIGTQYAEVPASWL